MRVAATPSSHALPAGIDAEAPDNPPLAPVKHRVTAKVRAAIDAMVWQGLKRGDAAEQAGLKDHSLYVALTHAHVKAYLHEQMEVLRTSERPRNIHRAIAIRDAADNMPAMHAIKWLEGEQEQTLSSGRGGAAQSPGVTFVIVQSSTAAPAQVPMRDVTPRGSAVVPGQPADGEDNP